MEISQNHSVGILAFGSLIDNPGDEIKELESHRIKCETPFKVEFARISSTRCNAPTLVPVANNAIGSRVKAVLIVLKEGTSLLHAKSVLWRRECHKVGSSKGYKRYENPTPNKVLVESLDNFCGVNGESGAK